MSCYFKDEKADITAEITSELQKYVDMKKSKSIRREKAGNVIKVFLLKQIKTIDGAINFRPISSMRDSNEYLPDYLVSSGTRALDNFFPDHTYVECRTLVVNNLATMRKWRDGKGFSFEIYTERMNVIESNLKPVK